MGKQNPDPLLTTEEAAEYLNVTERSMVYWRRKKGVGPDHVSLSPGGTVRYRQSELDRYIEEHTYGSVTESQADNGEIEMCGKDSD